MDEYSDNIVAFLDILGFKAIINQMEFEKVLEIFRSIFSNKDVKIALNCATPAYGNEMSEEEKSKNEEYNRYNESLELSNVTVISDSIVVSTPAYYPESLAVVVDICDMIQQKLFSLEKPVLLRGAVVVGEIFLSDEMIFGKGLIKAYLAQENYAVYPRIIISNEVTVGRRMNIKGSDLPKDSDGYYRIDCFERYLNSYNAQKWEDIEGSEEYDKIKNMIDFNLNGYCDDRVRQKYLWIEKVLCGIRREMELKNGTLLLT